ncbi:MAG TPA: DUF1659 domain-containing protein [Patescibacteria group bacterium]|nr:DUF1659 domain-containing protein [Patescibacteria group bacterium]
MAVVKTPQPGKLIIRTQKGVNAAGQPTYRQQSYANLKPSAADADVYAVGQGLGSLQTLPVTDITRQDAGNLVNQ